MKLRRSAPVLALLFALLPLPSFAQNTFSLEHDGKTIGTSVYTISPARDGFRVSSRYQYRFPSGLATVDAPDSGGRGSSRGGGGERVFSMGSDFQFRHEYKIDANTGYLGGTIIDANTQMTHSYSPNKKRDTMTLGTFQAGGQAPSMDVPLKPVFQLLPDYDPSSVQAMLTLATSHPTADQLYWIVVPRPAGGARTADARWVEGAAAKGTLDGKPVTLRHFMLVYGETPYEIFADDTNTLMQVNVPNLHASYVRKGFSLVQSARQ